MKIAIVHNDYGKFSGEEAVVRDHAVLLRELGSEVVEFRRSSTELVGRFSTVKGFLCGIWNPFSARRFAAFLEQEKPDVVHVHNLYPLLNPCILPEAKRRRIPVVMTVHNFRLFCPNGLFTAHQKPCEKCAEQQSVFPCLQNNCLNSQLKTLGYALRTRVAQWRRWYLDGVDCFLCLTEFQRKKLVAYGIPKERCSIVPNFIDAQWLKRAGQTAPKPGGYVAYMGRLSEEKGIDLLLAAARQLPEIPFKLAGNGADAYRAAASANVEFVGYLTGDAQFEFMHHAKIQIMASRCYENFPTTLLQGMALGIPALVPDHGGMPEIIRGAGEAYSFDTMTSAIKALFQNDARLQEYRQGALQRIQSFSPAHCGNLLTEIYLASTCIKQPETTNLTVIK